MAVAIPQLLTVLCRNSFEAVLEISKRLCARLQEVGPDQAVDIDGALQCQAFDVIGRVGFRHDYNATADLSGPGAAGCRTVKEGGRKAPLENRAAVSSCRRTCLLRREAGRGRTQACQRGSPQPS